MKNDLPTYVRQLRLATKKSHEEFASAAGMNVDVYSDIETGLAIPNLVDFICIVLAAKSNESERSFVWKMLIGHYRNDHGDEIFYDGRAHKIFVRQVEPWSDATTVQHYRDLGNRQAVVEGNTEMCPNGHRMEQHDKVLERILENPDELPPGYIIKDVEISEVWDQLPAAVKMLHQTVGKHTKFKVKILERTANYDCGLRHSNHHAGDPDVPTHEGEQVKVVQNIDHLPDGFYVASGPMGELMMVALKGKVYQMKLDTPLNDGGWTPGHVLRGPIQVNDPACSLGFIDVLGNGRFRIRPTDEVPTPKDSPPKFRSIRDILSDTRAGMTEAAALQALADAGDDSECTPQEQMEFVKFMGYGGPRTAGVDKAMKELERDVHNIFVGAGLVEPDRVVDLMEEAVEKLREAEPGLPSDYADGERRMQAFLERAKKKGRPLFGAVQGGAGMGRPLGGYGTGINGFTEHLRGLHERDRAKERIKKEMKARTKAAARRWRDSSELTAPGLYMVKDPTGETMAQRLEYRTSASDGRKVWSFVKGPIRAIHGTAACKYWGPIPE